MRIFLQHKIFIGYFLLMAIIGSMVAIVLHERNRVQKIEDESITIFQTQHDINTAHRYVTALVTYGESVLVWDNEDTLAYRKRRVQTDSILQVLRVKRGDFIRSVQIDSLRTLLAAKEEHLFQIMEASRKQRQTDSLLFNQKPTVITHTTIKNVTRKKKGIAGFFGGKETVQLPVVTTWKTSLDQKLISQINRQQRDIEVYTDSLRLCNKELNRKLRLLITSLDEQTWTAFRNKEARLKASYERSTVIITGLIIFSIILLVILYLVIQRDIKVKAKNRKHLEETIEQNIALLEMRKNIILTISHDIRAPLNVISGSAELAMDTREKKRRNTHLNNIRIVCRHVVHLLNNLLDVYRLNEAKETRNDVPFNLNALLERIAFGFSHVVNNKGILFNHEFTGTDVKLCGDVDRIEQILDNLLSNAVKFTDTGTISLNARYNEGKLLLEVKDTGIGMSKDALSRIFRPFERLGSVRNAEGFGLGLPITKGLVNLLGGTIDVTSDIDRGSTFRVTLPLKTTDETIESESLTIPHPAHLPQNVLVIDDDAMLLDVIKEMLERNGMNCTACTTTKDIVKAMRGKDYDLLLSDIQMPGTNGFDLLTLLRRSNIGNSRTIPIIAMTARGDRDKEAFLHAGFTDYIYKPFSSSELLGLLSRIKTDRREEKPEVDFNMVLSEVSDKYKALLSFISQSEKDREELDAAIKNSDRHKLREITHRMQPMWELLRMEEPLLAYRTFLKDCETSDKELNEYTQQIIDSTATLIRAAEAEIKRLTNETENTDS